MIMAGGKRWIQFGRLNIGRVGVLGDGYLGGRGMPPGGVPEQRDAEAFARIVFEPFQCFASHIRRMVPAHAAHLTVYFRERGVQSGGVSPVSVEDEKALEAVIDQGQVCQSRNRAM